MHGGLSLASENTLLTLAGSCDRCVCVCVYVCGWQRCFQRPECRNRSDGAGGSSVLYSGGGGRSRLLSLLSLAATGRVVVVVAQGFSLPHNITLSTLPIITALLDSTRLYPTHTCHLVYVVPACFFRRCLRCWHPPTPTHPHPLQPGAHCTPQRCASLCPPPV